LSEDDETLVVVGEDEVGGAVVVDVANVEPAVWKVVGREEAEWVPIGRELSRLLLEERADRNREGRVAVVVVDEVVSAVSVEVCGVHALGFIPDHDSRRCREFAGGSLCVEEYDA
jgi:hypothetical protein